MCNKYCSSIECKKLHRQSSYCTVATNGNQAPLSGVTVLKGECPINILKIES